MRAHTLEHTHARASLYHTHYNERRILFLVCKWLFRVSVNMCELTCVHKNLARYRTCVKPARTTSATLRIFLWNEEEEEEYALGRGLRKPAEVWAPIVVGLVTLFQSGSCLPRRRQCLAHPPVPCPPVGVRAGSAAVPNRPAVTAALGALTRARGRAAAGF